MVRLEINGVEFELEQVEKTDDSVKIAVNSRRLIIRLVDGELTGNRFRARIDNRIFDIETISDDVNEHRTVIINRKQFLSSPVESGNREKTRDTAPLGPALITSPMSGRIIVVKKQAGDPVNLSESILVLEAMKMENDVAAPKQGVVREVYVKPGSLVRAGDRLALIE